MFLVTNVELYAVTTYYSCTVKDGEEGNEFEFTLKEISNEDLGSLDNEIIWLGESPDNIDEDELIDACYSQFTNSKK